MEGQEGFVESLYLSYYKLAGLTERSEVAPEKRGDYPVKRALRVHNIGILLLPLPS